MRGTRLLSAARCAEYVPKIIFSSVLTERFSDPPLGELVLACEALGVDPQQRVDAVPGPLRHLSGIDTAVQPRDRQACRRSYGRRASGEPCSAAVRAASRALIQARRYVIVGSSQPRSGSVGPAHRFRERSAPCLSRTHRKQLSGAFRQAMGKWTGMKPADKRGCLVPRRDGDLDIAGALGIQPGTFGHGCSAPVSTVRSRPAERKHRHVGQGGPGCVRPRPQKSVTVRPRSARLSHVI